MIHKKYRVAGLSGCVQSRFANQTNTIIQIFNAEQADLCSEGGPWVVVCDQHGTTINTKTLANAKRQAACPVDWCGTCEPYELKSRRLDDPTSQNGRSRIDKSNPLLD